MKSKNILRLVNKDKIIFFFQRYKNKIKTVTLPLLIGIAVLFFWFYGSGEEKEIEITNPSGEELNAGEGTESAEALNGEGQIYVDIDGEINKPGVYIVSEGTRLFQIIELAGGLTDKASTDSINRAEAVYDGQKIIILSTDKGGIENNDGNTKNKSSGIVNGRVNINTADAVTLQTIPGIGPSKAARIIQYRNTSGRFKKPEDIKNVTGIGDKTFESIKDYITV